MAWLPARLFDRGFGLEHDGEVDVAFTTSAGGSGFVPHAEALMEVAKDKFQFATATEAEAPLVPAPRPQVPEVSMETRLAKLEQPIATMASSMQALTAERVEKAKPPLLPLPPQAVEGLPGLDPGVVKSALTAGIDIESLKQFSQLLADNPARRLTDSGPGLVPKKAILDESEDEAPAVMPEETVPAVELQTAPPGPYERCPGKADHVGGGFADPEDEARLSIRAGLGRCGRRVWFSRWWRDLQQKQLLGSPCLEAGTSRESRGDLYHHREVESRLCVHGLGCEPSWSTPRRKEEPVHSNNGQVHIALPPGRGPRAMPSTNFRKWQRNGPDGW